MYKRQEYDTAAAVERAGGQAEIVVVRNLNADMLRDSVRELRAAIGRSQMMILPGGFSAGDESLSVRMARTSNALIT